MNDEEARAKAEIGTKYSILVVDDEESIRITLAKALGNDETEVEAVSTGREAIARVESGRVDLVLLDQNLKESGENGIDVLRDLRQLSPDLIVIMMTAYGRIESAVDATKLGCYQYLMKPMELPQLRLLIKSALSTIELQKEVEFLRDSAGREFLGEGFFGESEKIAELIEKVGRVARSETSTILIRGETGTGKELISRMIHYKSGAKGQFVDLNCAALPDHLLESELFGHEPGAFTDAKKLKRGLLEVADRGTLFLDEIGEMPLNLQAKLLRVLETKTFRRVGATTDIKVRCRFVAATNKNLFQEVEEKRFREDLYYRLSVIPLMLPPLRDRPEDVSLLARYFMDRFNREVGGRIQGFSTKSMELLCNYRWPGNVRELKNLMERVALLGNGPEVTPADLPANVVAGDQPASGGATGDSEIVFLSERVLPMEEVEKAAIMDALTKVGGNKTKAAELLGIARQTIRTKIKDYEIDVGELVGS